MAVFFFCGDDRNDRQLIEATLDILGAVISMIEDKAVVWREFLDCHQESFRLQSAATLFEAKFKVRVGGVIRVLIARLAGLEVQD